MVGGKVADIKQDSCDLAILAFGSELHPEVRGRKEYHSLLRYSQFLGRHLKVGEAELKRSFP